MGLEHGTMTFSGGPHDGEKISTWLPSEATKYIYRSTAKGDDTIYRTNSMTGLPSTGDGFVRYFKFYNVWKYEQDVVLSHLLDTQQIDVLRNISAVHR